MTIFQTVAISIVSTLVGIGAYIHFEPKAECVVTKAETDSKVAQGIDYSQYDW